MAEEQTRFNPTLGEQFAPISRSVDWEEDPKIRLDPDPIFESAGISLEDLDKLMKSDERLGGLFISAYDKISGSEYAIRQPEDCPDNVYDEVKAEIDKLDTDSFIKDALYAIPKGAAFLEIVWDKAEKWGFKKVIGKPTQWFTYFGDDNEPRFLSKDEQEEGEPLPPKQFIIVQHLPTYEDPYGWKLAALSYYALSQKREIDRLLLKFLDKQAMDQLVGKVPPTTPKEKREKFNEALAQMRQRSTMVIDDTDTVESFGSSNKGTTAQIFRKEIDARDKAVTILWKGGHLSTDQGDGNTGSLSLGETHERSEESRTKSHKKMVMKAFNDLIRYYVDVNFGEDVVAPEFYFEEPEDIQGERAERDGKLNQQGVKMKKPYYARAYNLEDDEFEVEEVGEATEEIVKGEPGQEPDTEEKPAEPDSNQFAEFGEFMSEEFLKRLSDSMAFKAQDALEAMIKPLIGKLKNAKTYEEAEKIIESAYPDLDTDNFQDIMARALAASGVQGMKSA